MATEILVFVPGILGSELWDGGERVWPGSLWDAIGGFSENEFQQLLKPGLIPKDIVRDAVGGFVGVYRAWIKAFEGIRRGGTQPFRENPTGGAAKTLYVFPYDWRLDLRDTAKVLADFLDDIAKKNGDVDIRLVCHSMGGLLARYYLESDLFDARAAFKKISLLLTFGTPHNGAPKAYASAVGLHKADFLSIDQTRRMANDERYPSLFQLFPVRGHSFIWHSNPTKSYSDYSADHPDIVKRYKLNATNMDAWLEFRKAFKKAPETVRYFYVVGSTQETLVRLLWTGNDLEPVELDDAGDGTVPLLSALHPNIQTDFVEKSHVSLIETRPARQTLAALFGGTTVLAAEQIGRVTLSVRDLVVTAGDEIHVQIAFEPEVDTFKGRLRLQRAVVPEEGSVADIGFVDFGQSEVIPVELKSAGIGYINLKTKPLKLRGVYRPVLQRDGAVDVVGPEFVVQSG